MDFVDPTLDLDRFVVDADQWVLDNRNRNIAIGLQHWKTSEGLVQFLSTTFWTEAFQSLKKWRVASPATLWLVLQAWAAQHIVRGSGVKRQRKAKRPDATLNLELFFQQEWVKRNPCRDAEPQIIDLLVSIDDERRRKRSSSTEYVRPLYRCYRLTKVVSDASRWFIQTKPISNGVWPPKAVEPLRGIESGDNGGSQGVARPTLHHPAHDNSNALLLTLGSGGRLAADLGGGVRPVPIVDTASAAALSRSPRQSPAAAHDNVHREAAAHDNVHRAAAAHGDVHCAAAAHDNVHRAAAAHALRSSDVSADSERPTAPSTGQATSSDDHNLVRRLHEENMRLRREIAQVQAQGRSTGAEAVNGAARRAAAVPMAGWNAIAGSGGRRGAASASPPVREARGEAVEQASERAGAFAVDRRDPVTFTRRGEGRAGGVVALAHAPSAICKAEEGGDLLPSSSSTLSSPLPLSPSPSYLVQELEDLQEETSEALDAFYRAGRLFCGRLKRLAKRRRLVCKRLPSEAVGEEMVNTWEHERLEVEAACATLVQVSHILSSAIADCTVE